MSKPISEEEYKKIRARDMIEELILKGKASKAEYLLGRYIKGLKNNDYVQQMYYYRTKAYIAIRCTGDYEAAKENFYQQILFGQVVLFLQLHFLIAKLIELVLVLLLYSIPHKSPKLL